MNLEKKLLRDKLLKERKEKDNEIFHNNVYQNLKKVLRVLSFSKLGLYWPLAGEPNLVKIIIEQEILPLLPKVDNNTMFFVPYKLGDSLTKACSAGFFSPESNIEMIPEVIVVPGVAFDVKGRRLGFGFGNYDKYFNNLATISKKVTSIGVCFHYQLLNNLPVEEHDLKLDYIITDQTIIKI